MSTWKRSLHRTALYCAWALFFAAAPVGAQETPAVAEGKVGAALDRSADRNVAERLRATFATLEDLAEVAVEVEAGVVRLDGVVDSSSAKTLAGALAQQIEGVTAVENAIEETRSVERRLRVALGRLEERTWDFVDSLPLLVLAIAVFLLGGLIARLLSAWDRPFQWLTGNVFLQDLSRQALRASILLVGALLALEIMDATALVGAVLGAAGVVGLALGFAFRDLVENYIASILLSVRQPFAPKDLVRIDGHLGQVARLTSRATVLVTPDGNHVRIPNGVVFKATIENYTRKPERRFSFKVGVGVEEDLVAAQDLGLSILESMKGVLDEPAPFTRIDSLGDSTVAIELFGWVDQRSADFGKVKSEAIRLIKQAFDQAQVDMPEPIHRVRIEKVGAAAAAPPSKPRVVEEARDVSPDRHLDDLVDEERAAGEPDLLSEDPDASGNG